MSNFLENSVFFGVFISIITYEIGVLIKKKLKLAIFNPLLISIALIIVFLLAFHIKYNVYESGAQYLSYFLTPATVALAVPLYEQIEPLKKNWKAIVAGILSGALTSALCVLAVALIFQLDHKQYVTLLPKSITTAIGMGLSEELGGIVTITVAVIVVTGVIGNMFAESICKLFHITDPVAKGIGIGSASHAMGTAKAMEMGEIEGAMSSLSIAVSGLLTVVVSIIFAQIY
ncbi:MAG: LrgB family protein [Lachnospiraceae bacterium]|nr:LrgB family protein [Lachnospiraceae bacterium]MDD7668013.1 LrgB family protein [Lachnospiraceae bacterium]MDY2620399.1 LrgB family protein [Agathobacter sp.]